jgi:hypothetical protein
VNNRNRCETKIHVEGLGIVQCGYLAKAVVAGVACCPCHEAKPTTNDPAAIRAFNNRASEVRS